VRSASPINIGDSRKNAPCPTHTNRYPICTPYHLPYCPGFYLEILKIYPAVTEIKGLSLPWILRVVHFITRIFWIIIRVNALQEFSQPKFWCISRFSHLRCILTNRTPYVTIFPSYSTLPRTNILSLCFVNVFSSVLILIYNLFPSRDYLQYCDLENDSEISNYSVSSEQTRR
jgi:hypothetical protein